MPFLKEKDLESLRKRFESLVGPVQIINFTQELECRFCRETRQLVEEVSGLSDKISLQVHNFQLDSEKARVFQIDKIPATVVMGPEDAGIRFYGIPSGYEFASLLESIETVSTSRSPLSGDILKRVSEIDREVHIQVFVTPTCPYCPAAVVTGHALAHANPHIKADMVEATEFPHLIQKYRVMGVPRVVINENTSFEGALPEREYVEQVFKAIKG